MAEQWISSGDAIQALAQMYDRSERFAEYEVSLAVAADTLLKRLANDALRGRTIKGQMSQGDPLGEETVTDFNDEVLPTSFWSTLNHCDERSRDLDWVVGNFSYSAGSDEFCFSGKAFDVHFDASGIPGVSILRAENVSRLSEGKGAGRPTRFDWPDAVLAIFGLIYRGELMPTNQADVERALLCHLSDGLNSPSESTVRPYAKKIWDEYSKA